MSNSKHYLIIAGSLLVILITLGFVLDRFFPIKPIQSAATDNVSGWAWSETIGWISFNCTDRAGVCANSNYGVNIDPATGNFSGYAWSENIGWISFNRLDTGNPPAAPYNGGSGPIANLDSATKRVRGWARALANGGGWDGWIKLGDGTTWPGGGSPPSVDSQVYVQVQAGPDEFRGWGWGGGDSGANAGVVGWISFNCADRGICATSNYKVFVNVNYPPTATNLQRFDADCCADNPAYSFSWVYSDPDNNPESRFEFQVDTDTNPDNGAVINRNFTGLSNPSPTTNTQSVLLVIPITADRINYNTTYYWRVKVYDQPGLDSGWVNGQFFTTPLHHYPKFPDPDFTWLPYRPSPDEQIQFNSSGSTCYDNNLNGSSCVNILNGGDDIYYWDFVILPTPDGDATPAESSETNPKTKFRTRGAKPVTLTITDGSDYACTASLTVLVRYPLPKWREIKP